MEEIIKQLVVANATQQQTNASLQQGTTVQQEAIRHQQEAIRQQQEANRLLSAQLTALTEATNADRKALTAVVQQLATRHFDQPTVAASGVTSVRASYFLQKLTPNDDVEAYLTAFERTAERERWPKEQWAGLVAPFLSGEPQNAYFDLDSPDAGDYDKLKAEILARLGVTLSVGAQRVHHWTYHVEKPPRSQMHDLIHLTKKWLQPEILTGPQIVERVVMDRYLKALSVTLRKWVSHADPKTADQLIEMVERYTAAEELISPVPCQRPIAQKARIASASGKTVPGERGAGKYQGTYKAGETVSTGSRDWQALPGRSLPNNRLNQETIRCFHCQMLGHMAANCPGRDEPMHCGLVYGNRRQSMFAQAVCAAVPQTQTEKQMCSLSVEGKQITALLDSGSLVTLVKSDLVQPQKSQGNMIGVICIQGDTRDYPTAKVKFGTPVGSLTYPVGLVPSLLHDAVVWRDFPHFWELWENRGPVRLVNAPSNTNVGPEPFDSSLARINDELPEDVQPFPFSVLLGNVDETETGSEDTLEMPELEVQKDNFGSEQMKDPTLARARENVQVIDGKPVEPNLRLSFPYMALIGDMLYQVSKKGEDIVEQIVVPKPYRRMVLDLAHGHIMGGHLGVEKSTERILKRFFWPGLYAEIKEYCNSCPECQISSPRPHYRSPLVPLPIIEVPFERIDMDLVGR
ncbi:uncharacterized protein LOC121395450 [Xenopus laevis]|uniref:Gypsy retrotransposon integrase-like protein 1 n=1 Tax=Xenopus laevis TaxID=8355 RepID=A0A8J1L5W3_XENLA|nr:uncharacterized protein LOC121395450 [Xenopus laevis]